MPSPPQAAAIPAPVFIDDRNELWHPTIGPAELADIRAGGLDLAELAADPPAVVRVLNDGRCLLALAAFSCRTEARPRGIDFDGFIDRLLGLMADPVWRDVLAGLMVFAVARALPDSTLAADIRQRLDGDDNGR